MLTAQDRASWDNLQSTAVQLTDDDDCIKFFSCGRALEERKKEQQENEEKTREEVLAKRKQEQQEATQRFQKDTLQKKKPTQNTTDRSDKGAVH